MPEKRVLQLLNLFSKKGGIVRNADSSFIFYGAAINFIDNVSSKRKYYFYYKLIFRRTTELDANNPPSSSLFLLEADSCFLNENDTSVEFLLPDKTACIFTLIDKVENQNKFDNWQAGFKNSRDDYFKDMSFDGEIDKQWAVATKSIVNRL